MGSTTKMTVSTGDKGRAEAIQESLAKAGIKVTIETVDPSAFYATIGDTKNRTDIVYTGWCPDYPSGSTFLPFVFDGRYIKDQGNSGQPVAVPRRATMKRVDEIAAMTDIKAAAAGLAAARRRDPRQGARRPGPGAALAAGARHQHRGRLRPDVLRRSARLRHGRAQEPRQERELRLDPTMTSTLLKPPVAATGAGPWQLGPRGTAPPYLREGLPRRRRPVPAHGGGRPAARRARRLVARRVRQDRHRPLPRRPAAGPARRDLRRPLARRRTRHRPRPVRPRRLRRAGLPAHRPDRHRDRRGRGHGRRDRGRLLRRPHRHRALPPDGPHHVLPLPHLHDRDDVGGQGRQPDPADDRRHRPVRLARHRPRRARPDALAQTPRVRGRRPRRRLGTLAHPEPGHPARGRRARHRVHHAHRPRHDRHGGGAQLPRRRACARPPRPGAR